MAGKPSNTRSGCPPEPGNIRCLLSFWSFCPPVSLRTNLPLLEQAIRIRSLCRSFALVVAGSLSCLHTDPRIVAFSDLVAYLHNRLVRPSYRLSQSPLLFCDAIEHPGRLLRLLELTTVPFLRCYPMRQDLGYLQRRFTMRQKLPKSLLLLGAILLQPLTTVASPFPVHFAGLILRERACESPCGYYGQLCCSSSEECGTDSNGHAVCLASFEQRNNNGQWEYWTTTYVQTDYVTITSTGSSWVAAPTSDNGQCKPSLGETECGWTCCSASESCNAGECVEVGNSPIETAPAPTPPLRPTDTTGATITPTPPPGPTVPFIPPIGTDGSDGSEQPMPSEDGGGLSGGAIAGIVIGSLAGAAILLLLCCCLCVGTCVDRARGLLGLKGGSHSSSYTGSSSRSSRHGRTWFGAGPARPRPKKEKKSGLFGLGGMTTLALILGSIAVLLGLKKKKENRSEKSDTYYTGSSYYTYSYSGSSSSSSGHGRGGRR